jgi:hypothetical protein
VDFFAVDELDLLPPLVDFVTVPVFGLIVIFSLLAEDSAGLALGASFTSAGAGGVSFVPPPNIRFRKPGLPSSAAVTSAWAVERETTVRANKKRQAAREVMGILLISGAK